MNPVVRYESECYFNTPNGKKKFPSIEDKASVSLSVIVPSYNEEERLPVMLDEAIEHLESKLVKEKDFSYEIIVVDDGSRDKTTQVAQTYSDKYGVEKIRVLTLKKNRGKGGAVRLGMLSARGSSLLMVDADGATRFSDLDKIEKGLKGINMNGKAITVGSRAHLEKDSISNRSVFRTFLMKCFHVVVWLLCVRTVKDSQCGFKLFTRPAAYVTFMNMHVERWAFDVELLFIAEQLKIPINEIAVVWTEIDGSKIVPVFSWLQMGRDIILIWFKYLLGIWQIKENID